MLLFGASTKHKTLMAFFFFFSSKGTRAKKIIFIVDEITDRVVFMYVWKVSEKIAITNTSNLI